MPTAIAAAGLAGLAAMVAPKVRVEPRLRRMRPAGKRAQVEPAVQIRAATVVGRAVDRFPTARRRRVDATCDAVVELLEALAADLSAGRPAPLALARVVDDVTDEPLAAVLAGTSDAVRTGDDVSGALRSAAAAPACGSLRWLAAAWTLADSTGAGLAAVVEQLATSARREGEHRREVEAQLAAPRATARLLAALPLVGLGAGQLVGAHPLSVLLGSPAGWGCLATGVLLDVAGIRWTNRLARAAALA